MAYPFIHTSVTLDFFTTTLSEFFSECLFFRNILHKKETNSKTEKKHSSRNFQPDDYVHLNKAN